MTLIELIRKLTEFVSYGNHDRADFTVELFDQDNWQYEIESISICQTTKRILFNLKLIEERKET